MAAVDVVRPSAEAKGIVLNEVVDAPDGVVFGDASRLQQAIWNLLSNAVKFTNEGGRIEARLGRAEGQIEITVSDTGIGIEPQISASRLRSVPPGRQRVHARSTAALGSAWPSCVTSSRCTAAASRLRAPAKVRGRRSRSDFL